LVQRICNLVVKVLLLTCAVFLLTCPPGTQVHRKCGLPFSEPSPDKGGVQDQPTPHCTNQQFGSLLQIFSEVVLPTANLDRRQILERLESR